MNKEEHAIVVVKNEGTDSERKVEVKTKRMNDTNYWLFDSKDLASADVNVEKEDILILPSGKRKKITEIYHMEKKSFLDWGQIRVKLQ